MRNIQSCVIRWLVDTEQPAIFRGNVHSVHDGKRLVFQGERDLLRVLRQLHNDFLPENQDHVGKEEQ